MLTYQDCVGLCELTADEVEAIARHERLPRIAALELGAYLVQSPEGERCIRRFILDDIEDARSRGAEQETLKLKLVLRRFCETHPAAQGDG